MLCSNATTIQAFPLTENRGSDQNTIDNQIIQEFEESDAATRTDIIIQLWQPMSGRPIKDKGPSDISRNIQLGLQLFDRLHHAGQLQQARSRISETIGQVFEALNRGEISVDGLDNPLKARFFALALACISVSETMSAVDYLHALQEHRRQFLPFPEELAEILPARKMLDSTMLDITVHLLAGSKEDVFSTATLFYNPADAADPFNVAPYLQAAAQHREKNAQEKLDLLTPGQKLLIPIMSTTTNPRDKTAADGHFSAIVAIKTILGCRFCIFDSITAPNTDDNKAKVIDKLIRHGGNYNISIFRNAFQYNNDCGIHTYNFFKLCLNVSDDILHDSVELKRLFLDYVGEQYRNNAAFFDDTKAHSRLLRLRFVVDCIRNGYSAGLHNDACFLELLYQQNNGGAATADTENAGNSSSLWHQVRCRIQNLFTSNDRRRQ